MKITPEVVEYRRSAANLFRTGKNAELSKKIKAFLDTGTGFTITKIERKDYNLVINRGNMFWRGLGFKEINMTSTKTSKRANALIKRTRYRRGKVFYNCGTKQKLGFLIPTREWVLVSNRHGMKYPRNKDCYTIVIL